MLSIIISFSESTEESLDFNTASALKLDLFTFEPSAGKGRSFAKNPLPAAQVVINDFKMMAFANTFPTLKG